MEGGGYEIKMPGSLSNEDEGQDDMDFEDDMPGEVKVGEGGGGVSFTSLFFFFSLFLPPLPFPLSSRRYRRLECGVGGVGERACPARPRREHRGWMDGSGSAQSRHYCDV